MSASDHPVRLSGEVAEREKAEASAAADDGVGAVAKREQQPPLPRGGSRPAENASYRRATCACAPLPRSLPLAAGANLTV